MRVYIAGPMTGYTLFNFPAFDDAAARGRAMGFDVVSPADLDRDAGFDEHNPPPITAGMVKDFARRDLEAIQTCDAIALLPGWRKSTGANAELAVARWLGLDVLSAINFKPMAESALEEAQRICYGDRNETYGHPLDDYTRTAALWSTIIGAPVTPEKAILCMVAVKISRACHSPKHRDSWVDICGYGDCGWRVVAEQERRNGPKS